MYAVEKNPNAIITLRNRNINEWNNQVTIINKDMRECHLDEKADIIISELLGSFSDNELSPECLDGAQCLLKENGISIPKTYTSFLSPVSTPYLYMKIQEFNDVKNYEIPYVVNAQHVDILGDSKPCFKFIHPKFNERIDNNRYIV